MNILHAIYFTFIAFSINWSQPQLGNENPDSVQDKKLSGTYVSPKKEHYNGTVIRWRSIEIIDNDNLLVTWYSDFTNYPGGGCELEKDFLEMTYEYKGDNKYLATCHKKYEDNCGKKKDRNCDNVFLDIEIKGDTLISDSYKVVEPHNQEIHVDGVFRYIKQ